MAAKGSQIGSAGTGVVLLTAQGTGRCQHMGMLKARQEVCVAELVPLTADFTQPLVGLGRVIMLLDVNQFGTYESLAA